MKVVYSKSIMEPTINETLNSLRDKALKMSNAHRIDEDKYNQKKELWDNVSCGSVLGVTVSFFTLINLKKWSPWIIPTLITGTSFSFLCYYSHVFSKDYSNKSRDSQINKMQWDKVYYNTRYVKRRPIFNYIESYVADGRTDKDRFRAINGQNYDAKDRDYINNQASLVLKENEESIKQLPPPSPEALKEVGEIFKEIM